MALTRAIKIVKQTLQSKEYAKAFLEIMEVDENETLPTDYPNSDSWRKAEIPAANGHGTASGIAKFFGILASGGSKRPKNAKSRYY